MEFLEELKMDQRDGRVPVWENAVRLQVGNAPVTAFTQFYDQSYGLFIHTPVVPDTILQPTLEVLEDYPTLEDLVVFLDWGALVDLGHLPQIKRVWVLALRYTELFLDTRTLEYLELQGHITTRVQLPEQATLVDLDRYDTLDCTRVQYLSLTSRFRSAQEGIQLNTPHLRYTSLHLNHTTITLSHAIETLRLECSGYYNHVTIPSLRNCVLHTKVTNLTLSTTPELLYIEPPLTCDNLHLRGHGKFQGIITLAMWRQLKSLHQVTLTVLTTNGDNVEVTLSSPPPFGIWRHLG